MRTKLSAILLLAGSCAFAGGRVFFGVGARAYPAYGYYASPPPAPPPAAYYAPPPSPGPGYAWVGGSWYPSGSRYYWRNGYWGRRPYAGAYWAGPRYYGHRYYRGYWRR